MSSRPRQIAGILLIALAAAVAALAVLRQVPLPVEDAQRLLPRLLVLGEAGLALVLACWVGIRRRADITTRVLVQGALIVGAALALRLFLPPWAFFHENRHGYRYFAGIVAGDSGYLPPSTYYVLMHALTRVFGGTEAVLFMVNVLFSTASVPLVGLVARQVSGQPLAGWAAMGLWALTPHAIRMAPTETYYDVSVFFLFAATAATIHGLRRMDDPGLPLAELILAAVLTALAAQTRALTLLWPASVLLLAYGAGVIASRRQWIAATGIGAVTALLMAPKVLIHLGRGEPSQGHLFDPTMLYTGLLDIPLFDRSVVSILLPPLALAGIVALLRGRRRLGVPATLGLAALFVVPTTTWLQVNLDPARFLNDAGVFDFQRSAELKAILLGAGVALTVGFVWALGRPPRGAGTRRGVSLAGAAAVLGALLPLAVSTCIQNRLVSSLRFDLAPHALVTVLGGVGIAALVRTVPLDRWPGSRPVLAAVLALSALTSMSLAWRPFADPVEHEFLREAVIPALRAAPSPVSIVVPIEMEGSGTIHAAWWSAMLDAPLVVEDLQALPPEARAGAWAFIGYTCYWAHDDMAHEITPHIEGHPRLHARCAAALRGVEWAAVETLEIPWDVGYENVRPFPNDVENVVIGLYRAREAAAPVAP